MSCPTTAPLRKPCFARPSKEYPDNDITKGEFDRATARLMEQQTGKYPLKRMLLARKKRRPPLLDHATYVGPVSVRPTESHGRGLFTTEAVRAGDLLLCGKALAYVFFDTTSESKNYSYLIKTDTHQMIVGPHAELVGLIAQKLYKNPSLTSTFTDLYHGSYMPADVSEVDGTPVVDSFLIERTGRLNAFGCPPSMRTIHLCAIGELETPQLDTNPEYHSCGVWTLASYINHSCYETSRCTWIGDMMMDGLVSCWMIVCGMYREVAPYLVDQAEEYAKTTYKVCVGDDETFADTYSRDSERFDGLIFGGG